MKSYEFLGKTVSGRFTIPSGIVTVTLDTIERIARSIPQLGILTTKSIGPEPRPGNPEPVYAQVDGRTFVNAVGLANPGTEMFAAELERLRLPEDKFLLVSIFGGSPEQFRTSAELLTPYADGFELNLSCPHARGFGQEMGKDPDLAAQCLKAAKDATSRPVICKLSPNVGDLGPLASALLEAGTDGFTVINTCGPVEYREPLTNVPVLSNKVGGVSGPHVKEEALRCVRQVRAAVTESGREVPIVGMGGIATAEDVRDFEESGASFFGVGTALTGMDSTETASFFAEIDRGACACLRLTPDLMKFREMHIGRIEQPDEDLRILWAREELPCRPGQFVFVWLPGQSEKPFAPAFDAPSALVVRRIGPFTSALFELGVGDAFYVRGPYGTAFNARPEPEPDAYCLVGGGTGIAPLLLLAKRLGRHSPASKIHAFLGGRNAKQVYFEEEFRRYATLHVATEDGTQGFKGLVTELLGEFLEGTPDSIHQFYNCGPERMEQAAFEIQRSFPRTGIQTSIERYMKCGVGICGVCSLDGRRTCVDGPILEEPVLVESEQFGRWHRAKTGELEPIR